MAGVEEEMKTSDRENGCGAGGVMSKRQSTPRADRQEGACKQWVSGTFRDKRKMADDILGNAVRVGVRLSKQHAQGEVKVCNLTFKGGDPSIRLEQNKLSPRFEFTASNWDKPAYMLFRIDHKIKSETAAVFEGASGNIPFAWMVVFIVLSIFFFVVSIYHNWILPRPTKDHAAKDVTASNIVKEFFETFKSFFTKKQAFVAILFMLLYRFPEAQLVKLINPFLFDPLDTGGLGLTTGQVGFVYGTVGILGLTLVGIIG